MSGRADRSAETSSRYAVSLAFTLPVHWIGRGCAPTRRIRPAGTHVGCPVALRSVAVGSLRCGSRTTRCSFVKPAPCCLPVTCGQGRAAAPAAGSHPARRPAASAGGTLRPAYRNAKATTTTSSSGPITGRNSGMRSIGETSHRPASTMATPTPSSPSRIAAVPGWAEGLVDGLVHPVGVVVQELLASLKALLGPGGLRQRERVAGLEVAPPAAQPLQAVLLLLQLGQGELAQPLLLGQLGLVLAAVGDELGPLLLTGAGELGRQQRAGRLVVRIGVQDQHLAVGAAGQLTGTPDAGLERRGGGDGPGTRGQGERAEVAQLPPDRHPMARRPGG